VTLLNKDQSTQSVFAFTMLRIRLRFQRISRLLRRYRGPAHSTSCSARISRSTDYPQVDDYILVLTFLMICGNVELRISDHLSGSLGYPILRPTGSALKKT